MLEIAIMTLALLFAGFAFAQQPETSPPPPAAPVQLDAAAPTPTARARIGKLPTILEGRWERTFSNFQKISNITTFIIISQNDNGKILGKFTSLGTGSFPCGTVKDIPMEGEYDGETLIIRATPSEPGCNVWRLTLRPGESHMFEWKSSEKGDTIGRASVAGIATAYYDAVK